MSMQIDKENKNFNGLYSNARHLSEIFSANEPQKALEYLKLSLSYAKELNEPFYIVDTLSETANFYLLRKDFENAYKYYIQILHDIKDSPEKESIEKITSRLAYIKKYTGEEVFTQLQEKYGK